MSAFVFMSNIVVVVIIIHRGLKNILKERRILYEMKDSIRYHIKRFKGRHPNVMENMIILKIKMKQRKYYSRQDL